MTSNRNTDVPIRDAATLIVIDTSEQHPRILMGLRNRDLAFMPGKFVFPGGRVDPEDCDIPSSDELSDHDMSLIQNIYSGYPGIESPRALGLTAIRETFEETGIIIGENSFLNPGSTSDIWNSFFDYGIAPALGGLKFCARAITPANRVRRFDTRFFCVNADRIAKASDFIPGELIEICWLTFDEALDSELPSITRIIVQDIRNGMERGTLFSKSHEIPFYHMMNGEFRRDVIL